MGGIKYIDEAGEVAGSALKRLGKAKKLPEAVRKNPDITQNLPDTPSEAEQNYISKYIEAVNRYIDKSAGGQNRYIDTGYGAMNAQIEKIKEVRELTDDEWDAAMGVGEFSGDTASGGLADRLWRDDVDKIAGGTWDKSGIPKIRVDEILKTPKGSRPDPITYLSTEYTQNHLSKFNARVTEIVAQAPIGTAGPPSGTFVMPSSIADALIAQAGGNISKLEQLLGLLQGSLGTNPVRIDIANPMGLRLPNGNELGANSQWIPGGYTSGGLLEAIIDSPKIGQYIITSIK